MFLYVILTAVKRHRKYIKHIKDDKNVSPDIIYVIWAVVVIIFYVQDDSDPVWVDTVGWAVIVIKSSMYRMTVSLYG